MGVNIRIETHCINKGYNIALAAVCIGASIWLAVLLKYFSPAGLVGFLIVLAALIGLTIVGEKVPTVVEADGKSLRYRHLLGWRCFEYSKIKTISCEPNVVSGRYSSIQCVKLTVITDDDECELNCRVDTNEMVSGQMEGRLTDIPIVRLYGFVKEKVGK